MNSVAVKQKVAKATITISFLFFIISPSLPLKNKGQLLMQPAIYTCEIILYEQSRKKTETAHGNGKYLVAHNEHEMIQKLHEGFRLVQSLNHDKYLMEIQ